jgi:hypothetical protein
MVNICEQQYKEYIDMTRIKRLITNIKKHTIDGLSVRHYMQRNFHQHDVATK